MMHDYDNEVHVLTPHWLNRRRARRASVGRVGSTAPPSESFTRLWPTSADHPADAPLFLLAVAPVRVAALALLWATSSPGRLAVVLVAVAALFMVVIVLL